MQIFTYPFEEAFTINSADKIYLAALKARAGEVTLLGDATFQGLGSQGIVLQDGESAVIPAQVSNPIEGLTVTPASGAFCDTMLIS